MPNRIMFIEIEKILEEKGKSEIERHAMVSIRNRHYCRSCFCCACLDYLKILNKGKD